jgi:hypothetical protein
MCRRGARAATGIESRWPCREEEQVAWTLGGQVASADQRTWRIARTRTHLFCICSHWAERKRREPLGCVVCGRTEKKSTKPSRKTPATARPLAKQEDPCPLAILPYFPYTHGRPCPRTLSSRGNPAAAGHATQPCRCWPRHAPSRKATLRPAGRGPNHHPSIDSESSGSKAGRGPHHHQACCPTAEYRHRPPEEHAAGAVSEVPRKQPGKPPPLD